MEGPTIPTSRIENINVCKQSKRKRRRTLKDPYSVPPKQSKDKGPRLVLSPNSNLPNSNQGIFDSAKDVTVEGGVFNNAGAGSVVVNVHQNGQPLRTVFVDNSNPPDSRQQETVVHKPKYPDLPISSPERTDYQLYVEHLLYTGRGTPLFLPGPNNRLPKAYRQEGVRIGDVGIVNEFGGFSFLFNIFEEKDGEINRGNVPKHFKPVHWNDEGINNDVEGVDVNDVEEYTVFDDQSWVGSRAIKRIRVPSLSGFSFETQASEGVILAMPHGAISKDLVNRQVIREYMAANLESWYQYANHIRGREANNGDIRLVYGCDKTASWGIGTFRNGSNSEGPKEATTQMHFTPVGDDLPGHGRLGTYVWSCMGGGRGRSGPSRRELKDLVQKPDPSAMDVEDDFRTDVGGLIENQCVFVRTLNAMLSEGVWMKLMSESKFGRGGGSENEAPDSEGRDIEGGGGEPGSAGGPSGSSQSTTKSGSNAQGVRFMTMAAGDAKGFPHPSMLLNRSLLAKHPNAKMVITEDSDWCTAYKLWEQRHPEKMFDLVKAICHPSTSCENEGIVHLEARAGAQTGNHKCRLLKRHTKFYDPAGDLRIIAGKTLFKIKSEHLRLPPGGWDAFRDKIDSRGRIVLKKSSEDSFADLLENQFSSGGSLQGFSVELLPYPDESECSSSGLVPDVALKPGKKSLQSSDSRPGDDTPQRNRYSAYMPVA